ncbi:MAG: hypothetical protein U0412_06000 [Nitrospira sp.]
MTTWRTVMHRTGFLVLCLVPLLFDVAFCDELAASVRQAALVDIEEADPFDPTNDIHSQDFESQCAVILPNPGLDPEPAIDSAMAVPSSRQLAESPLSRPPPPPSSVQLTV